MRPLSAPLGFILIASSIVAGVALAYLAHNSESQEVIPREPEPKVAGRLIRGLSAEDSGGPFTADCEFDAFVRVQQAAIEPGPVQVLRVTEVFEQGDRRPVKAGDEIRLPWVMNVTADDVEVYWGDDGRLHAGCAPESVAYRGGQAIPFEDLHPDTFYWWAQEGPSLSPAAAP